MAYKILVLKGDGIGPEVVGEALQVLKVVARNAAFDLEFKEGTAGGHAIDQFGDNQPLLGYGHRAGGQISVPLDRDDGRWQRTQA